MQISNQLSKQILTENEAKFPTISNEVMQNLVDEYACRSTYLLDLLCNPKSLEQLPDHNDWTAVISNNEKLKQIDTVQNYNLSKKSIAFRKSLFQIIKEIQCFNSNNLV